VRIIVGSAPGGTQDIVARTIADLPPSIEHVRTGSLRALAVTTAERSPTLPAVDLAAITRSLKFIGTVSALPDEGKSTVSANLAARADTARRARPANLRGLGAPPSRLRWQQPQLGQFGEQSLPRIFLQASQRPCGRGLPNFYQFRHL
jgi:Tripartite tricarboxylate transporter family receptor